MIFSFGARRSGTWWLQRIVAAHPDVSQIPSETALFSDGLPPLLERFHHGVRDSTGAGRLYVEHDVLLDAARDFCDRVFEPYLEPGARYLAERSPTHSNHVDLIAAIYPDARLLHIVRDGRDVARSLMARDWGPKTVGEAAAEWRGSVLAARTAAPPDRYREIRYEELLADPATHIRELYEWLELPASDEALAAALAEAQLPRNQDPSDGRLMSGKWRDHFSAEDLRAFQTAAGDLLAELGYDEAGAAAPERRRDGATSTPATPAAGPRIRSWRGRVAWILRRARASPRASRAGGSGVRLDVGGTLGERQALVDRFLTAVHTGALEDLRALVSDGVTLRTVSRAGSERTRGPEALIAKLEADPAWRGRQVLGDIHPGVPSYSVVLSYELPDGTRADRVLEFLARKGRIEVITLYELPLGG